MKNAVYFILSALYRLAVLAGFIYLVRFVLMMGSGGWLFLISPAVLLFLVATPSKSKE